MMMIVIVIMIMIDVIISQTAHRQQARFIISLSQKSSAINFDANWYHIPVAQDYVRSSCIVPLPADNHKAYPHLASLIHTWALLVPGLNLVPLKHMLMLHIEFSIVLWRIVGVAAGAAWMLSRKDLRGLWPVFFLFPSVFIYDQNIGGSADHLLGFFAIPMFLALARAWDDASWRWVGLLGFLVGGKIHLGSPVRDPGVRCVTPQSSADWRIGTGSANVSTHVVSRNLDPWAPLDPRDGGSQGSN